MQAERQLRGVQPLPSREAETQVRGVQPLPPREGEMRLRGVHPLPPRQVDKELRGVQNGTRGSAEFEPDKARAGELTGSQAGARDQARTLHHSRLLRV